MKSNTLLKNKKENKLRITSIFLVIIMVFGAFIFSGCEPQQVIETIKETHTVETHTVETHTVETHTEKIINYSEENCHFITQLDWELGFITISNGTYLSNNEETKYLRNKKPIHIYCGEISWSDDLLVYIYFYDDYARFIKYEQPEENSYVFEKAESCYNVSFVIGKVENENIEISSLEDVNIAVFTPKAPEVEIHIISLKQIGDCILIKFLDSGKNMLIDTGHYTYLNNVNYNLVDRQNIINYLRDQGVEKIDWLMISHYHNDHAGNIEAIANEFDLSECVYLLPQTPTNEYLAKDEEFEYIYGEVSNVMNTGAGYISDWHYITNGLNNHRKDIFINDVPFTLYNEDQDDFYSNIEEANGNNFSLCAMMKMDGVSVFFSGDAAKQAQEKMLNQLETPCTIFKAPHHSLDQGNNISTEFFDALNPEVIVGSSPSLKGYAYLYDTSNLIAYAKEKNIKNIMTGKNGTILIHVKDGEYNISANENDYSTDFEIDTGKTWIDGKTIYRKVYIIEGTNGAVQLQTGANDLIKNDVTISHIDTVVSIDPIFVSFDKNSFYTVGNVNPQIFGVRINFYENGGGIRIYSSEPSKLSKIYVTIEFTLK